MSVVELSRYKAAAGFGLVFERIAAMVIAWNEARITRRELSLLTDRELTDIGVSRGDIERIARGA
ncbi:DUF1127 domain-containing protein [Paracoccus laeviglucosivorans]|uniref:YjiS-like domain-containing protein n=1 Tax=Paracoccus laeviglucosivorans TaxID=1197861 RepID=A0A521ERU0_9RHOB|nr:DUF1127 domain-containing protein [Paracoccus laeviglucosivorans]SMO86131.1 protein of unknown function [Paracoccus laeviglucosivorans]